MNRARLISIGEKKIENANDVILKGKGRLFRCIVSGAFRRETQTRRISVIRTDRFKAMSI